MPNTVEEIAVRLDEAFFDAGLSARPLIEDRINEFFKRFDDTLKTCPHNDDVLKCRQTYLGVLEGRISRNSDYSFCQACKSLTNDSLNVCYLEK